MTISTPYTKTRKKTTGKFRMILCLAILAIAASITILLAEQMDYARFNRSVTVNNEIVQINTENGIVVTLPKGLRQTNVSETPVRESPNGPLLSGYLITIQSTNERSCGWVIDIITDSYGGIINDPDVNPICSQ